MKHFSLIAAALLLTSATPKTSQPDSQYSLTEQQVVEIMRKNLPQLFNGMFTKIEKKASPAAVFIRVEINPSDSESFGSPSPYGDPFGDDFLNRFFGFPPGGRPMQPPQPQEGQGSGFLVSSDGYIMTNNHVIRGADKIEVTLNDGQIQEAKLIGADPKTDLAIIKIEKIDGQDYPYLELGDSDKIEKDEWVIAIGNPFKLQASATVGVVSATGRQGLKITDYEDFIQTDAAINPGNSGGPLLNLEGKVIGINTAIATRSGGYMGVGFAIPSNMASYVMDQLINKGSVTRGFLGISLQPIDKELAAGFNLPKAEGVLVTGVEKNSPAAEGGLQQGDILLELNGKPIKSLDTFRKQVAMMDPGSVAQFSVYRKGKTINLSIKLGSTSENATTPAIISQKLGIEIENLSAEMARQLGYTDTEQGVVITKVKPGSPAALAGLRPGCLIQAVNHKKILNTDDYEAAISENSQGKRIVLLVKHGKMSRFYSIRVE